MIVSAAALPLGAPRRLLGILGVSDMEAIYLFKSGDFPRPSRPHPTPAGSRLPTEARPRQLHHAHPRISNLCPPLRATCPAPAQQRPVPSVNRPPAPPNARANCTCSPALGSRPATTWHTRQPDGGDVAGGGRLTPPGTHSSCSPRCALVLVLEPGDADLSSRWAAGLEALLARGDGREKAWPSAWRGLAGGVVHGVQRPLICPPPTKPARCESAGPTRPPPAREASGEASHGGTPGGGRGAEPARARSTNAQAGRCAASLDRRALATTGSTAPKGHGEDGMITRRGDRAVGGITRPPTGCARTGAVVGPLPTDGRRDERRMIPLADKNRDGVLGGLGGGGHGPEVDLAVAVRFRR